jgi:hypothetical protein
LIAAPGACQARIQLAAAYGRLLQMREVRVVAIEIGSPGRGDDPHPAALQLADGRQLSSQRVINNLRHGIEAYVVEEGGRRSPVRIVRACPRCGLDYLRADDDATGPDRLMRLPSSPFGPPLPRFDVG